MPRALLALLLLSAACGQYSENQRNGLMVVGGGATLIGGVIAVTGATCSDPVAGGDQQCMDGVHHGDVVAGLVTAALGLAVGVTAYEIKPKAP